MNSTGRVKNMALENLENSDSEETWNETSLRILLGVCKEQAEFLIRRGRSMSQTDIKNLNEEKIYYQMAWGHARHIEDVKLMRTCTRLLKYIGLKEKEIAESYNHGYDLATTDDMRRIGREWMAFGL